MTGDAEDARGARSMNTDDLVTYEERGVGVAVVRLNRAAKRNALTADMLDRLAELFASFRARNDLRAVVLTGAPPSFCAGTDIRELARLDEAGALVAARRGQAACDVIEACPVPVVAGVEGAAAGGGCELALACHLRVAARSALFSLPELDLGALPAYGGTQRLPLVLGRGRALAVMLAGEPVAADEALAAGLVNRVCADGEAETAALELAGRISSVAPLAARACLRAVTKGARLPLERGLELEADLFAGLFATRDVREGTRAFLEKRPPRFEGR